MKKAVLSAILISLSLISKSFAQEQADTVINKTPFAVEIAFWSASISFEPRIGPEMTLKIDAGFNAKILGPVWADSEEDPRLKDFRPFFRVEPRYYYNFNRRVSSGRRTLLNGANYIAMTVEYLPTALPNWTNSEDDDHAEIHIGGDNGSAVSRRVTQQLIGFIPKWGMKRAVGNKLSFETAIGLGIRFWEHRDYTVRPDLNLRIGYIF